LAAISPSVSSHGALITALALARESSASLVLVQAVELNISGEERGIARGEFAARVNDCAESHLTELARSICGDVPSSVIVTEGPPASPLRAARNCGADAIVVGPRRSGFLGRFRRNTVQGRAARCPIAGFI